MIKKGLAVAVILLFVGMCVVPSTAVQELKEKSSPISFDGNTLYVGGSGPNNYTTIQSGIDNASDGDTIYVYYGIYYERVFLRKTLTIIGISSEFGKPVVDANKTGAVFSIGADGCVIDGFVAKNAGVSSSSAKACFMVDSYHNIIKNNICLGYTYTGIFLSPESDYSTIYNNTVSDCIYGIYGPYNPTGGSDYLNITNNHIFDCGKGIELLAIDYVHVYNNEVHNNREGILLENGGHNQVSENTVYENDNWGICIFWMNYPCDVINNYVYNNNDDGILISTMSAHTLVSENYIIGNVGRGVYIRSSPNSEIYRNHIENNRIGVHVYDSEDTRVWYNNIFNNDREASFSGHPCAWSSNYWDDHLLFCKIIFGKKALNLFPLIDIPWINIDLHAAKEPYDIGV